MLFKNNNSNHYYCYFESLQLHSLRGPDEDAESCTASASWDALSEDSDEWSMGEFTECAKELRQFEADCRLHEGFTNAFKNAF